MKIVSDAQNKFMAFQRDDISDFFPQPAIFLGLVHSRKGGKGFREAN